MLQQTEPWTHEFRISGKRQTDDIATDIAARLLRVKSRHSGETKV